MLRPEYVRFVVNQGDKTVHIVKGIAWLTKSGHEGIRVGSPLLKNLGRLFGGL